MPQTSAPATAVSKPAAATDDRTPDIYAPIASPWHTLLLALALALLAYSGTVRISRMQAIPNPPRIMLYRRTILMEWIMLGLALLGVWWHGSSLLDVLGPRWRSVRGFLRDVGLALLFLVLSIAFSSVMGRGSNPNAIRAILPGSRMELLVWVALSLSAGICEEAVYRGYLQRQFIALTKSVPAGIILSAIGFGAAHIYQGPARAVQISFLGAMAGILAYWCKSVRPGMIGHTLQDVLGGLIRH